MKKIFQKNTKTEKYLHMAAVFFFCAIFLVGNAKAENLNFEKSSKRVVLVDEGMTFESFSDTQTVQDFLNENKIVLKTNDAVFPDKNEKIFSGTRVIIMRAKKIKLPR